MKILRVFIRATALLLCSNMAYAEQYRSTGRTVDGGVSAEQANRSAQQDPEAYLRSLQGNAYAQALALQQLGSQALNREQYKKAAGYFKRALKLNVLSGYAAAQMRDAVQQIEAATKPPAKPKPKPKPRPKPQAAPEPEIDFNDPRQLIAYFEKKLKKGERLKAEEYLLLAQTYAQRKQYRKAEPHIKSAFKYRRKPPEDWYKFHLAVLYELRWKKSLTTLLEKMVSRFPYRRDYWLQLTGINLQRGRKRNALAVLELAHKQNMLTAEPDKIRFVKLFLANDAPYSAGSLLQNWLDSGELSNRASNWELLAAAWTQAREIERAIPALENAARRTGKGKLYMQLGQLNLDLSQWSQAESAFATALNKGGLGVYAGDVYLALGLARYRLNDLDGARTAFQQAQQQGRSSAAKQWLTFLDAGLPAEKLQVAKRQAVSSTANARFAKPKDFAYERQPESDTQTSSTPLAAAEPVAAPVEPAQPASSSLASSSASPAEQSTKAPNPQFAQLGNGLTAVGARQLGNADGSLPDWEGGLTQPPAGFKRGQHYVDPFTDDKPLFVVTNKNASQYKQWLSAGHQAMLKQHASFQLPVYASRRTAAFPAHIYAASIKNAQQARLRGTDDISRARVGFPFPKPATGAEVIWNHKARYRGQSVVRHSSQAVVTAAGRAKLTRLRETVLSHYGSRTAGAAVEKDNTLLYYLRETLAPGKVAGQVVLVHEPADHQEKNRRVWFGSKQLGKLLRVPEAGYNTPSQYADGLQFVDQIDMYNGGFDSYTWKLLGKREMLVPYNSYRINSPKLKYKKLLKPKHLNPALTRYERHRVWVVEATLRPSAQHSFHKRVFYVDEDSWTILQVENYDAQGRLWRFQEAHLSQYYDIPAPTPGPYAVYDLRSGRYFVNGLINAEDEPVSYNRKKLKVKHFSPAAVKRKMR